MLDDDPNDTTSEAAPEEHGAPAATDLPDPGPEPEGDPGPAEDTDKPARKATAKKAGKSQTKKTTSKRAPRKTAKTAADSQPEDAAAAPEVPAEGVSDVAVDAPAEPPKKKAAPRKRAAKKTAAAPESSRSGVDVPETTAPETTTSETTASETSTPGQDDGATAPAAPMVLFKAPEPTSTPRKRTTRKVSAKPAAEAGSSEADQETAPGAGTVTSAVDEDQPVDGDTLDATTGDPAARDTGAAAATGGSDESDSDDENDEDDGSDGSDGEGGARRRRRRGGRRRRKPSDGSGTQGPGSDDSAEDSGGATPDTRSDSPKDDSSGESGSSDDDTDPDDNEDNGSDDNEGTGSRRRRRRRRSGDSDTDSGGGNGGGGGGGNGGQRARKQRNPEDEITSIGGSTRLEAKKQRRREGREAGRRRAPIVSEAEFLARREAVDRVMVIRQKDDLTQIGVLEDKVLVEHYVARESQTSLIGNVYLGRVQNVLPSMEAAFVDIGKGRNAVLYAGEVNWSAVGHKEGQPRKIESVLSAGQTILVQVSKDPIGHKGARLTGQVSLPGRFLVYVPDGNTSGISRKLPDTERNRLKTLLKQIVPDSAGVIVRTAAEGASEDELTLDVERLTARWGDIEEKVKAGKSPQLLYGEPDLTLKVVRDLFTEDFGKLVVQGDDAWDLVENYVAHVAPDLAERLERFEPGENGTDLFAAYRVDEQIAKGLDRKVWLPSGGSLVIDRTEAMTVVDVNTGKFTGSGGNLEETVTKNNLEAAEEIVRQLRLRDIGGIIVVDFIDMVLESNRDLVLRRLVECLGRDRTRHQVAEVTSLGLVQMTRKRIGTGLLEAFSTDCEACKGRGLVTHEHPVESGSRPDDDDARGRGRGRGGRNRGGRGDDQSGSQSGNRGGNTGNGGGAPSAKPSPADLANTRPPEAVPDTTDAGTGTGTDVDTGPRAGDAATQSEDGRPGSIAPESPAVRSEVEPSPEPTPDPEPEAATPVAELEPQPAATEPPATAPPATEPQPAATEPQATEPPAAEPAAPRVVTTTRRRTARRPAGPPSAVSAVSQDGASPGPTEAGSDQQTPDQEGRDREGSDRAHRDREEPRVDVESEPGEGEELDSNGFALSHVPVKRKGSRKR